MSTYIISLTVIGIASLAMAWMPAFTEKTKISYSIFYVLFGMLLFYTIPGLPVASPVKYHDFALHLTELVVIISIMGTGIKIDEPLSWKTWLPPFKLVTLTMVLSIGIVTFIAWYFLNLNFPTALLLGSVLAPTDPVLASDVQVGPPSDGEKDNTKFALTAEAGMNDGAAFPFVWLAIALAATGSIQESGLSWLGMDVLYRIAAGVVMGIGMGKLLAYLLLSLPKKKDAVIVRDGFVGIAATLAIYGLTEMISGYGFIAVFVTAITLRNTDKNHSYHKEIHNFTEQVEKILVAITLLLLGGTIVSDILQPLTWYWLIFGFLFLLIIRPATAMLSMIGVPYYRKEKLAISFFGIRGIGSFFYLAFALKEGAFANEDELWAIVVFILLASIVIHGLTDTSVTNHLSGKHRTAETAKQQQEKDAA